MEVVVIYANVAKVRETLIKVSDGSISMIAKTYIKKIVFDLDGVIRNLMYPFEQQYGFKTKKYNFRHNGRNFWDMAREHPEFFIEAPVTKYYNTINKYVKRPTIWTFQHKEYRDLTEHWVASYFDDYNIRFFRCGGDKYKRLREKTDHVLIEDAPNFPDYTRVILIDQPWNKGIEDAFRVSKVGELEKILKGFYT